MLNLKSKITLDEPTIRSPNLCDRFEVDDLQAIGNYIHEGYKRDRASRERWEKRVGAAMDLALQIQKVKNFPWPNAANVKFPLVTIATMQFHAQAYPAVVQAPDVVKCRVLGEDPSGQATARATRISRHMSYQVLEEDRAWEEQHDRLLINLPVVGSAFKKSYYSPSKGHNVSELVLAQDLVLDYYSKSVDSASRKTHVLQLYRNEIHEKVLRGSFRDVLEEHWYKGNPVPHLTVQQSGADLRAGTNSPPQADSTTPFTVLEQHIDLDLDQDGYAEPYIITIEEGSQGVLRIVTRFDREDDIERDDQKRIIKIRSVEYFTKYSFIPSPDGGIYDIGFGVLLGPLNESTDTLINQLIDAGTMSTTGGGFLGKGVKVRGGVYTFAPLEWKRVDSSGDDLQKGIFPLPVREPSAVLFNLLSLLINYTNRVASTTDMMVGENPGQNTPAETARTMVEQGQKVYNAIFKRIWRCMKEEFKKLYVLNGLYLPASQRFGSGDRALREDYLGNPEEVVPAADPNVTSDSMRINQVSMLKQSAMATPGYDIAAVERRFLKALKIDAIDEVYPGPDKVPPSKHPKVQIEEIKLQGKQMQWQHEQAMFAATLMEEQRVNNAKILQMEADVAKTMADIPGDQMDREINAMNTALGVLKAHNDVLTRRIELVLKELELGTKQADQSGAGGGGVAGVAGTPGNEGALPILGGAEAGATGAMG